MDKNATLTEADKTFTELLQLISLIDEDKINIVPFEDSWTAGQVAQHIILSAGGFVQLLNGPVKDTARDPEQNVANLRAAFLNFNIKMKSPDFIIPPDKIYQKQELVNTLGDIKTGFLKAIDTLDLTKTCTLFEMPILGYITRAEGIAFTIVHTQRHIHQLKKIYSRIK